MDLEKAMRMYPDMVAMSALTHDDTYAMARLVHNEYRRSPHKQELLPKLLKFVDTLIQDLQSGALPPHRRANIHLISFLKDAKRYSRGFEFWSWLVRQDEEHLDAAVYGAALELLAYHGEKLESLETLYNQALKRFPGTFTQYHLLPEAIVPDRSQPVTIRGLPMTLLQAITTARVLHGDWRNGYLGLDTALRLFPTQTPTRFFEVFMYERSLAECYQIFMLACRSGVVLNPKMLTAALNRLVDSQHRSSDERNLGYNSMLIQGMLNSIHAYAGAGGTVDGRHVNVLLNGLMHLHSRWASDEAANCNHLISAAARHVVIAFARVGIAPHISTFNTLLTIAMKTRSWEQLEASLKNMSSLALEPDHLTHRILVTAAGWMEDPQRIEEAWKALVDATQSKGQKLDRLDWLALAKAVANMDQDLITWERIASWSAAIPRYFEEMVAERRSRAPNGDGACKPDATSQPDAIPELDATVRFELQHLMSRVTLITELIQSRRLQDFYEVPLPMSLEPPIGPKGTEEQLRQIYDELTTDPRQPPSPDLPKAVSATGFPLDELRFENWVTVNELLAEAGWYERAKRTAVDKAITTGKSLPKAFSRTLRSSKARPDEEPTDPEGHPDVAKTPSIDEARQEVLMLRGLPTSPSSRAPVRNPAAGL